MGKKKSKSQKKKFFAHPKNKNRKFVKKEKPPKIDGTNIKTRGFFSVIPYEGTQEVPNCSHGPCLLFTKNEKGQMKKFFSCAVYRSDEGACDFRIDLDENDTFSDRKDDCDKTVKRKEVEIEQEKAYNYGCIPQKLPTIDESELLLYCRECNDVFGKKHACVCEPVERSILRTPTRLLEALENQSGEAQYFFSDESLSVVLSAIEKSQVNGVLCIGAPRIFETLKLASSGQKVFLLDYDERFANFFPSSEFGQYSMLVDHFFDPKTEAKLELFFKKCEKVVVVVDPPFGVFIDPLMRTLGKIESRYQKKRNGSGEMKKIIVLPLFVGKHVLRNDKSFWMSDYKVTYDNHKAFSKPSKTIVRLFTDLHPSNIDLSTVEGYKFCEMCERHVSSDNVHCFMCARCSFVDGTPHRHCERCSRCVKTSYRHCRDCMRCHLPGRCRSDQHKAQI